MQRFLQANHRARARCRDRLFHSFLRRIRSVKTSACLRATSFLIMSTLQLVLNIIRCLSHEQLIEKRKELFQLVNSDVFFPVVMAIMGIANLLELKKPMTDEECFEMKLFFLGNGLEPRLAAEWVILTRHWCHDQKKMEKRARQIDWIIANMDIKGGLWFYFDIFHQKVLHLNGDIKGHFTVLQRTTP